MLTLTIMGWAVAVVLGLLVAYYYSLAGGASSEMRVWRERAEKLERRLVTCQDASKELRIAVASVAKAVENVHATGATVTWNDVRADHEGD